MTNTSSQKHANILGVNLVSTSNDALLRKITVDIRNNRKYYMVTPNPEIVMMAQSDRELLTALNRAEAAIPDGIGLSAADKFMRLPRSKNRVLGIGLGLVEGLIVGVSVLVNKRWLEKDLKVIKGRELFLDLIKLANKNGWKVYFLGGFDGEAHNAKKQLEKNYKNIKIRANAGPILNINGTPKSSTDEAEEKRVVNDINNFSPDILFVGISHPRQEKWLYRWYKKLSIGVAMTVGGTYRYYSGYYKSVPGIINKLGLEWLWRLLTGSQNFGRVFTAVVKFPLEVFKYKLHQK